MSLGWQVVHIGKQRINFAQKVGVQHLLHKQDNYTHLVLIELTNDFSEHR